MNAAIPHLPKRILIVEDDLTIQPLLERMLQRVSPGVHVDWATTAESALEYLGHAQRNFDEKMSAFGDFFNPYYSVVLSDIQLGGIKSGFDLVEDCFAKSISARFVLASGNTSIESNLPFIPKPFRLEEVKSRLAPYFNEKPLAKSVAAILPIIENLFSRGKEILQEQRNQQLEWLLFAASAYICTWTMVELPENLSKLPFSTFYSHSSEQLSYSPDTLLKLESYLIKQRLPIQLAASTRDHPTLPSMIKTQRK